MPTKAEIEQATEEGSRHLMEIRNKIVDALPEDVPAYYVCLAGLSLMLEIAVEFADDQEEFDKIMSQAKDIARAYHNHRAEEDAEATRH